MNVRSLMLVALLVSATTVHAGEPRQGDDSEDQAAAPVSLSELAQQADLVAVAQVKDTDYVYVHSFPNEGSAYLKVLITYKQNYPVEGIVEVYEKGLRPNECYFENPTVFEDGRRFLVFFRQDPEDPKIYRGLKEGCALELLVTQDNRYALKYPVTGIKLTDKLSDLAQKYDYHDYYAVLPDGSLDPQKRDKLLAGGFIVPYQDGYKYTYGVDLSAARSLISPAALKPKKSWQH